MHRATVKKKVKKWERKIAQSSFPFLKIPHITVVNISNSELGGTADNMYFDSKNNVTISHNSRPRLFTWKPRVHSQGSPCWTCGGQNGPATSWSASVLPYKHHFTLALFSCPSVCDQGYIILHAESIAKGNTKREDKNETQT